MRKVSEAVKRVLDEITKDVARGYEMIAPVTFSHCYGRAATAAAFRIAKADGLIEVAYTSAAGTPVYRGTRTEVH